MPKKPHLPRGADGRRQTPDAREHRLQKVIGEQSPDEVDRMREALVDLACGVKVACRVPRRGTRTGVAWEEQVTEAEVDGEIWEEFTVYKREPDIQAMKLLLDHNLGRPPSRESTAHDPEITVLFAWPTPAELAQDDTENLGASVDELPEFDLAEVLDPVP